MKRIYASLGIAAIGAAGIQSVQGQVADASKSWSVGASLRGFYDDNVNAAPKGLETESFGFEVSPTLAFSLPLEQTSISASYNYSYKWFEKTLNDREGNDRQTHTFAARLRHNFSDRTALSVQDSFVIGQEPDYRRLDSPVPIPGDNIRNYGAINFNAQLTRLFGIEIGYANALADYDDETVGGSSARLDRLEHSAHVDGRWNLRPNTVGVVGYQFTWVDYTGNLPLSVGSPFMSNSRNSRSHYGYVGVEHNFRPDLFGTVRGGARFSDYYNSPDSHSDVSPYAQASLTFEYAKESSLEIGVSYDRSATDQYSSLFLSSITLESDSTVAYLSVTQRIVPGLFGSVVGHYQHSTFVGGSLDQDSEDFYGLGLNLEYRFNRHVSANVGYSYDMLDSDYSTGANRDFDRNRAYIGATFVY